VSFYKVIRRYNIIQIRLFDDDLSWPSTLTFTKVNPKFALKSWSTTLVGIPPKFQSPMWSWYILLSTACHKTFNSQYQINCMFSSAVMKIDFDRIAPTHFEIWMTKLPLNKIYHFQSHKLVPVQKCWGHYVWSSIALWNLKFERKLLS
jgi:hypothetical protein